MDYGEGEDGPERKVRRTEKAEDATEKAAVKEEGGGDVDMQVRSCLSDSFSPVRTLLTSIYPSHRTATARKESCSDPLFSPGRNDEAIFSCLPLALVDSRRGSMSSACA